MKLQGRVRSISHKLLSSSVIVSQPLKAAAKRIDVRFVDDLCAIMLTQPSRQETVWWAVRENWPATKQIGNSAGWEYSIIFYLSEPTLKSVRQNQNVMLRQRLSDGIVGDLSMCRI